VNESVEACSLPPPAAVRAIVVDGQAARMDTPGTTNDWRVAALVGRDNTTPGILA
jgi:hypothetical protein